MINTRRIATWAVAAWLLVLPLQSAKAEGSRPEDVKSGAITITQAWSRATPGGAPVGGGYMTITNSGKTADRLLSVTSNIAARVSIHTMTMIKGVMRMRALRGGLVIEPGASVELTPGGQHLMLIGLKKPIRKGQPLEVKLTFQQAGDVTVAFKVEAIGAIIHSKSAPANVKAPGMMQSGGGRMPMKLDHGGSGSHNR